MLYQLLKPIVTIAVHIFYKKIEISAREPLNEQGPTLIVSNHNNAFLDAVVVEMYARPQIYSIARGDVFNSPFMYSILSALRIIPIYRKGETVDITEKNEETFQTCVELLELKQHIIMYPEGDCVMEKRLRKLKKGAARIALRAEAESDFNLNLRVLPVGLNYSAAKNFRSNLFINIGKPIYLNDYQQQYTQDPVKAINALTLHIEREMRTLVVDIHQPGNDRLYEDILALYKPQLMAEMGLNPGSLKDDYKVNCCIAKAINQLQNENPEELKNFKQHLRRYHETLDKLKIPYRLFTRSTIEQLTFVTATMPVFLVGVGMPLHILGIAFNYFPYRLAYSTANDKVKQVHFHASVNFVIGMFGWIAYYIIQLLIIAGLAKNGWITLAFALLIPATGLYSLRFYSFMKKTYARWNLFSLAQNNPEVVEMLLLLRQELVDKLNVAKTKFDCSSK